MNSKAFLILLLICLSVKPFAQNFNYPDIPDTITGQSDRVFFMASHYWDNADFSDSTLFAKPKICLDYIFLLQLMPIEIAENSIKATFDLLLTHSQGKELLLFWFDRYLHDGRSPFYDDNLYLKVLETVLPSIENDSYKNELQSLMALVQRNRIGLAAEDFPIVFRDGTEARLYDIEAPLILLIFNSPNCSLCHKLEQQITENDSIQQLIDNQKLKVLSVCPLDDYDDWISHNYPENWICGFDKEMIIVKRQLYEIQRFPSVYLLDKDKCVVLKETDYDKVVVKLTQ